MQFLAILGWSLLLALTSGPVPVLAEGPGCSSPPLEAGDGSCWRRMSLISDLIFLMKSCRFWC